MKKYDLSHIMSKAWQLFRKMKITFSTATPVLYLQTISDMYIIRSMEMYDVAAISKEY